jgi:formylglycine-generating enzyme required for sulfatase activity
VINEAYIKEQVNWYWTMRPYRVANVDPYVLKPDVERALKPGDPFRECAKDCPEMVVAPAGEFMMGSPKEEAGHRTSEEPQHRVVFTKPFAVSKLDVTFDQWDACVAAGGCTWKPPDSGMGRGDKPVIWVNWDDARQYVAWFSRMTGKTYRLLTEAEFEYARAGTHTAYPWAAEIDMHGNIWEWTEDCFHRDYYGAPQDGSAWIADVACDRRVIRGGSWSGSPQGLRAANRISHTSVCRDIDLGFRVGRTLAP